MRKAWRMPSRHAWRKLRSLPRASGFTFPSSTQTCICLAFWKVFLAQRSGWRPGSVKSAASPGAGLRRRLPEQMGAWGEDPRKWWDANDCRGALLDVLTSEPSQYMFGGAYVGLSVCADRGGCAAHGRDRGFCHLWFHARRRGIIVLRLSHAAQAVLDSRGASDRFRFLSEPQGLRHAYHLGPVDRLVVVPGRMLHRRAPPRTRQAAFCAWRPPGQRGFFLPGQQLQRVAPRLPGISQNFPRPNGLLFPRHSLLPQRLSPPPLFSPPFSLLPRS